MNLLKKGILTLLLVGGVIVSCDDDGFTPIAPVASSGGETMSVLSSFTATAGPDEAGAEDGTYITVTPLSIGVDSYVVDFGDGSSPVTISEQGGSASYDYPNAVEQVDYTIKVTTKATDQSDISKTKEITVTHSPIAVGTTADSPTGNHADVFAVFSNGINFDGSFLGYREKLAAIESSKIVTTQTGNTVLEYSRLGSESGVLTFGTAAKPENVVVAEAFAEPANDDPDGIGATHIQFDVHSVFAQGIDKLKITLINGDNGDAYVIDGIDLTDGEWLGLDYDLSTDFSAPVVRIDEIKFELGTGGTANDHATINVDNITLSKAPSATILNGGFDLSTAQWKPATFTDGSTSAFNGSSDGSWTNYDGSDNGSKTRGAKWSNGTSAGPYASSSTRYAYQPLTLTPDTDYILEFEYAIKDDEATDPVGGRRMVAVVLDGHFIDGADAVAAETSALGSHAGTIAGGKFSNTVGTIVQVPFTSNESGKVAIWLYAITIKDGWMDNVKVYQAP
ncbi:MAG: hypothetical protein COA50_07745 [Flavobacteriaceae bacterium]|nr:MAG: hypothetical protein COA50_07745 [Flavobacteriaceae bacterium]